MSKNFQPSGKLNSANFIWNTIGSVLGAGSSFVLLLCVTRSVGAVEGGIFSFAFASAQLLLTLGKYGVRTYQATDVTKRISAHTYYLSRILSCVAMLLFGVATIILFGYSSKDAGIIFAVCLIKMVDAVEDVYHGQLQLDNRLDIAGKLLAFRNLFTMLLFACTIFLSRNLHLSCWITGVVSLGVCIVINSVAAKKYSEFGFSVKKNELLELITSCFPLFLGQFLSLYIYNAPKYAIESFCSPEIQTYYAIIFMPAFVINLLSEFLFKPLLTSLAVLWNEAKTREFVTLIAKLIACIAVATVAVILVMNWIGADILSFIYNTDISAYKRELLILLSGGGFGAVVYLLYNVLISMRKQKDILRNYATAALLISVIVFPSVHRFGVVAAAISYLVAEIVLCALMVFSLVKYIRLQQNQAKGEETL